MDQQERSYSGLMKLLIHFVLLLLLQFSLPGTTGARVTAYIDAKGELYYAPVEGGGMRKLGVKSRKGSKPQVLAGRSTVPLKSGSGLEDNDSVTRSLHDFIQTTAKRHRVDPLLVKAVIKTESNFDPDAVSPKGAQGLMQLMPGTARDLQITNPLDPKENIVGGTKYLRSLLDSYNGDVELSLAAYNAGPGKVKKEIPDIRETKTYVSKVLGNYQFYRRKK
jgi:hypothetical protein